MTDILACPACGGELGWAASDIRCQACSSAYPHLAGIPALIEPSHPLRARLEIEAVGAVPRPRWRARLAASLDVQVRKSERTASLARRFVDTTPGTILNIGSGSTRYGPRVLNMEIAPAEGIDVIGVSEAIPLRSGSVDGVVLEAVLEHVLDAETTLAEIRRVLAPEGRVYVDVPFLQPYHSSPLDYRRYTELGLRTALERHGFSVEHSGVSAGPASAFAWTAAEFIAVALVRRDGRLRQLARTAAGALVAPLARLDRWLDSRPGAAVCASGVWAIGGTS